VREKIKSSCPNQTKEKDLPVQDSEELHDTLFAASLSRSWLLDNERMDTSVMTPDRQSTRAVHGSTQKLNLRLEPINPDKVVAVVLEQQVLTGNLYIVKLLVLELGQVVAPVLQLLATRLAVQNVLKLVAPLLQAGHKLAQGRLVGNKVVHKGGLDLGLE